MTELRFDRKVFFDHVRGSIFSGSLSQGQVDGLNHLLDVWEKDFSGEGLLYLAYCLGTAYHETARTMLPVAEYGKGSGRPYGRPVGIYGHRYYGRGHVQLTWERNYIFAGDKIGVDLHQFPEKALDPAISSRVLFQGCLEGWFTGKKLSDYSTFRDMRRVVNGTDRADLIATYAGKFERAVNASVRREVPSPNNGTGVSPMFSFLTKIPIISRLFGGGGLVAQLSSCVTANGAGTAQTFESPEQIIMALLFTALGLTGEAAPGGVLNKDTGTTK